MSERVTPNQGRSCVPSPRQPREAAASKLPWVPPAIEPLPPLTDLTLVSPESGGGDNFLADEITGWAKPTTSLDFATSVFGGPPQ